MIFQNGYLLNGSEHWRWWRRLLVQGIMAETLANNNVALALLGNTIATGAILVVLITMLGPVSGAHFNPAVSAAFALKGALSGRLALFYIICQIAGGICGTLLAHWMFAAPILQDATNLRSGIHQYGSEWVATFGLLMVIFGGIRHRPDAVAWMVGLYITAALLVHRLNKLCQSSRYHCAVID
jgi:glycerol uptake facilitator-like aquaporin